MYVSVAAASGITVIAPPASIVPDSPVLVGFNDTGSSSSYTVSATSTADPSGADLTGTVMPATNPVLKIVTDQGEMDFELLQNYAPNTVAQIENLVNSGAYSPSTYTNFTGTFSLGVGSTVTGAITFEANNLTATAANIQRALVAAGLSGATVTVAPGAAAPTFAFNVTFSTSESPVQYGQGSSPLPVSFSNSATAAATSQTLTFTAPTPDFYRIIQTFMDQGGISGLGNVSPIPVELNKDLRFTSSGLLAMANNGVDGNTSEFFVTNPDDMSNGFLDFRYTIFGKLISGDAVRADIASTPVTINPSSGETSDPLTPPKILSMSIVPETTGGGAILLKAATGAAGPYTVTVSDGTNTQTFTINTGTNTFDPPNPWVNAINGTDKITVTGKSYTFTPQGESATGQPVQVNVQSLFELQSTSNGQVFSGTLYDSSVLNYLAGSGDAQATPSIALSQNGSSYTLTPQAGFYGVQGVEIVAFTPVTTTSPATPGHGTFQLQIGSTTTAAINFDSTNLPGTAANMQSALRAAGFGGATVKVDQVTDAPNFVFDVAFATSQQPVSYVAASTDPLPLSVSNSATASATSQTLTFTDTGYTSNTTPVYRALVTVVAAPPPPVLNSITANGKTVTGSTFNNNGTTSTELSFNISGVISGATVGVFLDNSTTPLVTGPASGTTITLTSTGSTANAMSDGTHTFTVKQTVATSAAELTADWTVNQQGQPVPQDTVAVPAGSAASAASNGETITIGLFVLAQPVREARVGALYTYTVQTNAPSGDLITVTPVTLPAGMTFNGTSTFSWTPSSSQLNTSPAFEATASDSQGRTITIGPVGITVVVGLTPTEVPVNSTSGGNVTVSFSGGNVVVYDNVGKTTLSKQAFKATDTVEIDLPAEQANTIVVDLPKSGAPAPARSTSTAPPNR